MNITEHLINYRFYQANIDSLEKDIKVMRLQMDGQKSIDYSADNISSGSVSNVVESTVLNIIEKENELQRRQVLVQAIDRAVEELEDMDKQIIKMKYMDRSSYEESWESVAREVSLDRRQCIRRKDKALAKIAIVLAGVV